MSDTTRRHESQSRTARRGPKNRTEDDFSRQARFKSVKQRRVNNKIRLRREYL